MACSYLNTHSLSLSLSLSLSIPYYLCLSLAVTPNSFHILLLEAIFKAYDFDYIN